MITAFFIMQFCIILFCITLFYITEYRSVVGKGVERRMWQLQILAMFYGDDASSIARKRFFTMQDASSPYYNCRENASRSAAKVKVRSAA